MQAPESFERTAGDYDRARRALVNCLDMLYARTVECIPPAPQRILELGAGTGLLSAAVSVRCPNAELVLVDAAPAMLRQAEKRLAGHPALHCEVMDYSRRLPPGPFDAVVSALSIHHLADAAKQVLFEQIFEVLRPGGVFANADQVLGPTPEIEAHYQRVWELQARQAGVGDVDLAAALERQRLDISATLSDQLDWMGRAGFGQVDCVFKDYRFALMKGLRSA